MARRYLDEIVPQNRGIFGEYLDTVSPFVEGQYVGDDTTETNVNKTRPARVNRRKKNTSSRKDNIIRNHDSVYNYKIENGKLYTKKKNSTTGWTDITNNEEAVSKIENFTGKTVSKAPSRNNTIQYGSNTSVSRTNNQSTNTGRNNTGRTTNTTQQDSTRVAQSTPSRNYAGGDSIVDSTRYSQPQTRQSRSNQYLLDGDLAKNNWRWGGVDDITYEGTPNALYADAVNRAQEQGRVLLDRNGRPVTTSQVNKYLGITPQATSQSVQPNINQYYQNSDSVRAKLLENSIIPRQDVKRTQDSRRNREFDRQRNSALATMFGLPIAGIGLASLAGMTAPVAMANLAGGYLGVNYGGKLLDSYYLNKYGTDFAGYDPDPNAQFYREIIHSARNIDSLVGVGAAQRALAAYPKFVDFTEYGPKALYLRRNILPNNSSKYYNEVANMLLDPAATEPVQAGVRPGWAVEIPNRNIQYQPVVEENPLWYDTRFENYQRSMSKKRIIKSTKGSNKQKNN